ncbi:interleukin-20 receptor subunit alpha-like isoform X2 [Ascaphus truei]
MVTKLFNPLTDTKNNCTLLNPSQVQFSSINLKNVLNWLPPNVSGRVLYSVEYMVYGEEKWHKKLDCVQINETSCDLSNETYDYKHQYYAKVIAIHKYQKCWVDTPRFNPFIDTKIGPPTVRVQTGDRSISINVSFPENWKRNPTDAYLDHIFKDIEIQVSIRNTKTQEVRKTQNLSAHNLDPDTTYCVTAQLYVPVPTKHSDHSEVVCVTTIKDGTSEMAIQIICFYVLPVVLVIFTLLASGYSVHKYIHVSKLRQPQILNLLTSNNHNAVFVEAREVTINVINIEQDPSKFKMQDTFMPSEHKMPTKSTVQMINDEAQMNNDPEMMEEEHLGYVTLQQTQAANITHFTPYDMPHRVTDQQPPIQLVSTTPSGLINEESIEYRRVNNITAIRPVPEGNTAEVAENAIQSQRTVVKYIPKSIDVLHFPKLGTEKQSLWGLEETCKDKVLNCVPREPTDTTLYKCNNLYVQNRPYCGQLNISNLCNEAVEDDCSEDCQNVEVGLLSKLYLPFNLQDSSEEDELLQFKERWELCVQTQE